MPDESEPVVDWDSLTFSFTKTDRMYLSKCELGGEWAVGSMMDFEDLVISPAAGVLNYGQGLSTILIEKSEDFLYIKG